METIVVVRVVMEDVPEDMPLDILKDAVSNAIEQYIQINGTEGSENISASPNVHRFGVPEGYTHIGLGLIMCDKCEKSFRIDSKDSRTGHKCEYD